jgi:hypothetical protein
MTQAALAAALQQCTATVTAATATASPDSSSTADNSDGSGKQLEQLHAELSACTKTVAVLEQQLSETKAALLTALLKPQVNVIDIARVSATLH